MTKTIEEYTDKELETAIKKIDDLIRFWKEVKYPQEIKLALENLTEFLEKLYKEKARRK